MLELYDCSFIDYLNQFIINIIKLTALFSGRKFHGYDEFKINKVGESQVSLSQHDQVNSTIISCWHSGL